MKINKPFINQVVKKIVKNTGPSKVVLFGSFANKTANADSDIDLLVILETDLDHKKRLKQFEELFEDRNFPLDIVIYTPDEVKKFSKVNGSFIKEILEEGEVLYERAA